MIGVGRSDWRGEDARVRAGEKPHDAHGYAALALRAALVDAGVDRGAIDGLIVGPNVAYERMGEILGINPRWGSQAGDAGQALAQACSAIESGYAEVIAVIHGTDQRSAGAQYGGANAVSGNRFLAYVYHAPWGFTSQGALYALMFQRYRHLYGFDEASLGAVAVAQRVAAMLNQHALLHKPLSIDDYLASAYLCEPLRYPDYCLVNDGGAALIVAEAGVARSLSRSLSHHPAFILGLGRADINSDSTSLQPRLIDFYRPAQQIAGQASFDMAGLGPTDMDVLQVYDSFSLHVPLALEGYGYCEPGEAARFIADTGISLAGGLPINTSGGHLAESYMHGWNHQIEAVCQLRGNCDARQVSDCRFVHYCSDVSGKAVSIVYGHSDN
ncbi:thiolase family protein [Paraburkholderia sediminicola]|uniref:thiolase family protein n=1 Tax=Paraburkholderia sediminicola TaxID=458836 RepID=UPI0038B9ED7A